MPGHLPASRLQQDSDSRPYWDGLKQGELRIQRCTACSHVVFYPRSICPQCHADLLEWIVASGKGTIYSYTVAHKAYGPFAADVPFVIVLVELEEGARMLSRLLDAPRERVTIGAAVRVTFEGTDEELTLPYFRLID
jgi:uncharacterized OB-fold protein